MICNGDRAGNPLQPPVDALRFAIDFAQTDLDAADLAAINGQVDDFLHGAAGLVRSRPRSLDALQGTQAAALDLLTRILGRGICNVDLQLQFTIGRPTFARGAVLQFNSPVVRVGVSGSVRDWFLYRTIRLLEDQGVEKVMRCPACGRIFLKVTRKEFCSTRCQSRVYMRQYRAPSRKSTRRERKTR